MKLTKKHLLVSLLSLAVLSVPLAALAQPVMNQGLEPFRNITGLGNRPLTEVIALVVRIILSFLGLIAVIIIIMGGFKWMTAGGNEEKIKDAKKLMINGIIGLAIVVLAYAIATFIIAQLVKVGGGT